MNTAFAPGAEKFLAGRGGLRARILTDGRLSVGDAQLKILKPRAKPNDALQRSFAGRRKILAHGMRQSVA